MKFFLPASVLATTSTTVVTVMTVITNTLVMIAWILRPHLIIFRGKADEVWVVSVLAYSNFRLYLMQRHSSMLIQL